MFRAHRAHHQERQIFINTTSGNSHSVSVAVFVCRLEVNFRPAHDTTGCIDTVCLSWWWARCARNM